MLIIWQTALGRKPETLFGELEQKVSRSEGSAEELRAALIRLPSRLESIRNEMWQAAFQKMVL